MLFINAAKAHCSDGMLDIVRWPFTGPDAGIILPFIYLLRLLDCLLPSQHGRAPDSRVFVGTLTSVSVILCHRVCAEPLC